MSHKAVRVVELSRVSRFAYDEGSGGASAVRPPATAAPPRAVPVVSVATGSLPHHDLTRPAPAHEPHGASAESPEQAAFAQGYSQGERAGIDVAARQLQSVHERLGQTLEQLASLREELTYRTERQVVELALAMAARILHREVTLDRELLLVMARIAIDRMGDVSTATIRLHPDDEAAARGSRDTWPGGSVTIVADASVRPGACVVQTDQGHVEVGVDAQVRELATALLGDVPMTSPVAPR